MLGYTNRSVMCSNYTMTTPWFSAPAPANYNFVVDTPPSSSREMRNRAEKMRRDKINSHIQEMNNLLLPLSSGTKRLDKTATLRLAVSYLRISQLIPHDKSQQDQLFRHVNDEGLENLMLQLNGFFILLTNCGKIIFVSKSVEKLLGHTQMDLLGQSMYNITSPTDHDILKVHITPDSILYSDWRKYFRLHLKRAGPRSEKPVYENVVFTGLLKSDRSTFLSSSSSSSSPSTSSCDDYGPSTSSSSESTSSSTYNDDVHVFFVKMNRPQSIAIRLVEAVKDEYITRHLVDGRIVNCDQRISYVAGYMTDEICGLSAFGYMHRDDVRWVMIALRQMYDKGESWGQSCYRLLSKTNRFIYLRTRGYLEIDENGTVETFVCVNSLVNEDEGQYLIKNMKERYSAFIKAKYFLCEEYESSEEGVEDPKRLEIAINHLITNLPSPESRSSPSPRSALEIQDCNSERRTYSPHTFAIRVKTVPKRPPSTELEVSSSKRHKPSSEFSHLQPSPPYHRSPIGTVAQNNRNFFTKPDQYFPQKL